MRCWLEKKHNLKVESYVLLSRYSNLGGRLQVPEITFQITLKKFSEEARGIARVYRSFAIRAGIWNSKDKYLNKYLIKENQVSQVKEFRAFLCMGRCESWGLLKLFLGYIPQVSGVSLLFFLILFPQGVPLGMAAVWLQLDDWYSSLPSSLRAHSWGRE